MDLEGTEICDCAYTRGITAYSEYRVPGSAKFPKSGAYPQAPQAIGRRTEDDQPDPAHAAEWHIDPRKIGVTASLRAVTL